MVAVNMYVQHNVRPCAVVSICLDQFFLKEGWK